MGEASWPGRSLQVRAAPPIPGERTVSIDVAQKTSACIIATATYGSHMEPQVVYMRSVRDEMIGSSEVGETLVAGWNIFYYSWSPPIANLISSNNVLQKISQLLIIPLVAIIHLTASIYSNAAHLNASIASLAAFLFASISSTSIYIIIPLYAARFIRKKRLYKR
jgi:peptide/nickel transport system substrate-binding protein